MAQRKFPLAPPIIHVIAADEEQARELVLDLIERDEDRPQLARVEKVGRSQSGTPLWKAVWS